MAEPAPVRADDITAEQYERGLDLYESRATVATISAAIQLSEHQVKWLATTGDEARGMKCWAAVSADRLRARRRQQLTVGESIAVGAAGMIDNAQQIAVAAQGFIRALLGSHLEHVTKPALAALSEGPRAGESAADWLARAQALTASMALGKDVRETLKVLRGLADIEVPARTFREVWLNAHMSRHHGLSDALRGVAGKIDMSPTSILPAQVTAIEQLPGAEQGFADPLDADPEFRGMSLEEIEEYNRTGELPARAYGSDEDADRLPDGVDIDWDPAK